MLSFPILILLCVGGVFFVILSIASLVVLRRRCKQNAELKQQKQKRKAELIKDGEDGEQFLHNHVFPQKKVSRESMRSVRIFTPSSSPPPPPPPPPPPFNESANTSSESNRNQDDSTPSETLCVEYAENGPGGRGVKIQCQRSSPSSVVDERDFYLSKLKSNTNGNYMSYVCNNNGCQDNNKGCHGSGFHDDGCHDDGTQTYCLGRNKENTEIW